MKILREAIVAAEDRLKKMKEEADVDDARSAQRTRTMNMEVGKLLEDAESDGQTLVEGAFHRKAAKVIEEAEDSAAGVALSGALDELDKIVLEGAEKDTATAPPGKNEPEKSTPVRQKVKGSPARKNATRAESCISSW